MEKAFFDILVCPLCKGKLHYNNENLELMCFIDNYAYPIEDGIPVMLAAKARKLTADEITNYEEKNKSTS